jgi:capsular polysaccharide biosynthesis protein
MNLELVQLARILLRRWWLILIPTAIAGASALPAILSPAPQAAGDYVVVINYSAAQSLEAIPRSEGDYQDIWLSSELTVNAFTDWVRGSRFKQEIISLMSAEGITINPADLAIGADNERSVGRIYLYYSHPETLSLIATMAVQVMQTRNQAYFAQLGGEPATVTILDEISVTPNPPPIVDRFGPFVRVGLGLLAGIGLALLAHYLDPSLRRREDVELLGLPVISTIPKH